MWTAPTEPDPDGGNLEADVLVRMCHDPRDLHAAVLRRTADLLERGDQIELVPAITHATLEIIGPALWELGRRVRNAQGELEWISYEPIHPATILMNWTRHYLAVDDLEAWSRRHAPADIAEVLRGCAIFRVR